MPLTKELEDKLADVIDSFAQAGLEPKHIIPAFVRVHEQKRIAAEKSQPLPAINFTNAEMDALTSFVEQEAVTDLFTSYKVSMKALKSKQGRAFFRGLLMLLKALRAQNPMWESAPDPTDI